MTAKNRQFWWALKFKTIGWVSTYGVDTPLLFRFKKDAQERARLCLGCKVVKVKLERFEDS